MNKLNEFMAEVAGLEVFDDDNYHIPDKNTEIKNTDWHPDTDLNQAMMCLAKADVELFGILRDKNFKEGAKFLVEGTHCTLEELPLTICKAIKDAGGKDEK